MKTAMPIVALIGLFSAQAFAAPGGGHGGIPWSTIGYQAANILIILVGLIYFARKPITEYFDQRRGAYKEAAERAMQARLAAEQANREIKERVQKIESTEQQQIEQARVDAEALRAKTVAEANEAAVRMSRDAQRMIDVEVLKAKTQLQGEIIDEAFVAAEVVLREKMNEQEQHRLQGEFVNKIQVARS